MWVALWETWIRVSPLSPHPWRCRPQLPGLYVVSTYSSDTRADVTFPGTTNKSQTGECSRMTPLPSRAHART